MYTALVYDNSVALVREQTIPTELQPPRCTSLLQYDVEICIKQWKVFYLIGVCALMVFGEVLILIVYSFISVRIPGYKSRGPGSIPGATKFSKK
jgi:hypothetical protein